MKMLCVVAILALYLSIISFHECTPPPPENDNYNAYFAISSCWLRGRDEQRQHQVHFMLGKKIEPSSELWCLFPSRPQALFSEGEREGKGRGRRERVAFLL